MRVLQKTAEDAGIDKPVNPHHYRHTRASHLATKMTEAELCQWFGWVQGSNVPARYVHLSGRDLDDKYDVMHGIKDKEDEEEDDVAECPRCSEVNENGASDCYRCGCALNESAKNAMESVEDAIIESSLSEEVSEDERSAIRTLLRLIDENPEVKEQLWVSE